MTRVLTTQPPSDAELQALLRRSYAAWQHFLAAHSELRPEWKYYGAKAGWTLKLFLKSRNLCFLGAHEGEFNIAFLLGQNAVAAALAADLPDAVKEQIRTARRYAEGTPVRLNIRKIADLAPAATLLAIKRAH